MVEKDFIEHICSTAWRDLSYQLFSNMEKVGGIKVGSDYYV